MTFTGQIWNRPILADAIAVASWNRATEQFGTPTTALNLNTLTISPQYDTDEGKVSGANAHLLSFFTGVEVTMGGLGYDLNLQAVISNITSTESGSGDSKHISVTLEHDDQPYFGAVARVRLDEGLWMFASMPRMKVMSNWETEANESAEFSIPEVEMQGAQLILNNGTKISAVKLDFKGANLSALPSDFNAYFGL